MLFLSCYSVISRVFDVFCPVPSLAPAATRRTFGLTAVLIWCFFMALRSLVPHIYPYVFSFNSLFVFPLFQTCGSSVCGPFWLLPLCESFRDMILLQHRVQKKRTLQNLDL